MILVRVLIWEAIENCCLNRGSRSLDELNYKIFLDFFVTTHRNDLQAFQQW